MKKQILVLTIIFIIILIQGCGPTIKEQVAQAEAESREKRALQLKIRQAKLKEQYQRRIEKGEQPPAKVENPGYPIVICEGVNVGADKPWFEVVPNSDIGMKFICGNTAVGQKIVLYRKWYCDGEVGDCWRGWWKDNEPTFDLGLLGFDNMDITLKGVPSGEVFRFRLKQYKE